MTPAADRLWVGDDRPSRRYPIYTRGNTGEVYPNVITPLCGSIVTGPIRAGQARAFTEIGAVAPGDLDEPGCAVLTGCFGGYLYANLSIGRLMGARAPGMAPEDVDLQMFGTSAAPPYRRQPGDRNARATARLAGLMVRTLRGPSFDWLSVERRAIEAWLAARPPVAMATEPELLATVDEGAALLASLMRSLLLSSSYGGIAAAVVERLAAGADSGARARSAAGVGGVESAGPAVELWRLAQVVAGDPALGALFDGGPGIAARLDAAGDEATAFRTGFQRFLERYGARGPDEYELASDTWGTRPEIPLAAVERLRGTGGTDPAVVQERLAEERRMAMEQVVSAVARPLRPVVRRAMRTVGEGAAARELAKGTIIAALFGMRLALFELVRRAQARGGPAERRDCFLVTRDELPPFVTGPAAFEDTIAERAEQRDLLQSRTPPFVFEGEIPDPSSWPRRDASYTTGSGGTGQRWQGIGVSPGVARGAVRVVRNPSDPSALEPGDVLVAPITDPAWTPLFLVASAVVVEVGANMSHAAIVARELGIPAVVSVAGAAELVAEGTLVEVDGTAGSVAVLE
jgi:rifampicin phosphotransferase